MASCRRRDADLVKLMMSDYDVSIPDEANRYSFFVKFRGPSETPYVDGVWKVHVTLPVEYPFKSPGIGFANRLYHPNVDEISGSVCLDVINQTWSPMFDLVNVFDVFLPQLLRYPNPSDPLNGQAADMMMRDSDAYATKIKDYIRRYASCDFVFEAEEAPPLTPVERRVRSATISSAISSSSASSSPSTEDDDEHMNTSATMADDGNESDVSELSDL